MDEEHEWMQGPEIDGMTGVAGHLVFWKNHVLPAPWWIVEWQPDNGQVFVIVNAEGHVGTAPASELSRDFRKAGGGQWLTLHFERRLRGQRRSPALGDPREGGGDRILGEEHCG